MPALTVKWGLASRQQQFSTPGALRAPVAWATFTEACTFLLPGLRFPAAGSSWGAESSLGGGSSPEWTVQRRGLCFSATVRLLGGKDGVGFKNKINISYPSQDGAESSPMNVASFSQAGIPSLPLAPLWAFHQCS